MTSPEVINLLCFFFFNSVAETAMCLFLSFRLSGLGLFICFCHYIQQIKLIRISLARKADGTSSLMQGIERIATHHPFL